MNVVDDSGRVICREGIVLAIYVKGHGVDRAEAGQYIDEMCLAVEIPSGDYSELLLVDGDKTLASAEQANPGNWNSGPKQMPNGEKKPRLWSRLFKK